MCAICSVAKLALDIICFSKIPIFPYIGSLFVENCPYIKPYIFLLRPLEALNFVNVMCLLLSCSLGPQLKFIMHSSCNMIGYI